MNKQIKLTNQKPEKKSAIYFYVPDYDLNLFLRINKYFLKVFGYAITPKRIKKLEASYKDVERIVIEFKPYEPN